MTNKDLKDRIALIKDLKSAKDEASRIKNKLESMQADIITIDASIKALIEKVENLDKETGA